MLTTDQQAIIDKLALMNSLPGTIAWGTDADVGAMAGNLAGSRTQEAAARKAYRTFITMGGQAELDRLRKAVLTDPELNAAWVALIAAGNRGDWFSSLGNTFVSLVPTALTVAVAVAGADIVMGGTLISSPAVTTPSIAAEGATSAATATTIPAEVNVIADMTGAGISDVSISQSIAQAASSPGVLSSQAAIAETTSASWGALSAGIETLPSLPSIPSTPSITSSSPSIASDAVTTPKAATSPVTSSVSEAISAVAPKAIETAAQIGLSKYAATAKPARIASVAPPTDTQTYNDTNFFIAMGIIAAAGVFLIMKMKG